MRRSNSQLQKSRDRSTEQSSRTSFVSSELKRWHPVASFLVLLVSRKKAITFAVGTVTAIFILIIAARSESTIIPPSPAVAQSSSVVADNLLFTCPVAPSSLAANDKEATGRITEIYDETNANHNITASTTANELINTVYDGWDTTFNENKEKFQSWKVEQFSTLKSGDVIYESACGEGFNLAMTLQIIKEAYQINHVTVYGNDYIKKSVEAVHHVLEKLAPAGTKIGSMCQGDSSNLYFVPSDTFDLAYTGFIDPIPDPYLIFNTTQDSDNDPNNPYADIDFNSTIHSYDKWSIRENLCNAKKEKSNWGK